MTTEQEQVLSTTEIGTSGLAISGGFVIEEWQQGLRQVNSNRLYKEMRDNSPVIGAILQIIEYLLVDTKYSLVKGEGGRSRQAIKFVQENLDGMDHSFKDFLLEALSCLQYGWSFHEVVFKHGTDGTLRWRKIPLRGQTSLLNWLTDGKNNPTAFVQMDQYAPGTRGYPTIPFSKGVLFRTTSMKNNPEGRSILRSAVRPYNFLKRLEELEAIGIERELAGLPVLEVPPDYLDVDAPPNKKAQLVAFKKLLQQIRTDERGGIIIPSSVDPNKQGNPASGFKLSLMSTGGRRAIDTNVTITRYENRIATALLGQFILLGSGGGAGSYALANEQASVFTIALGAALARIESELNHKLIPELCAVNGYDEREVPVLKFADLQDTSLNTLATFINQLVGANVLTPDDKLEEHLREIADLPAPDKATQRATQVSIAADTAKSAVKVADAASKGSQDPKTMENPANVRTEPDPANRKVPK